MLRLSRLTPQSGNDTMVLRNVSEGMIMARRETLLLSEAIELFVGPDSRRAKRLAEGTIRGNRLDLGIFRRTVCKGLPTLGPDGQPDINVHSVTYQHISAWEDTRAHIAQSAFNSEVSILRGLFRWLVESGRWAGGPLPTHGLETVRGKGRHNFLRIDEDQWPKLIGLAKNPRDRFILQAGLYMGGRGGEIRHLTVGDARRVHPKTRVIEYRRFKTDGMTVFKVGLMAEMYEILQAHLAWYQKTLWYQEIPLLDEHVLIPKLRKPMGVHDATGKFIGQTVPNLNPKATPTRPEGIIQDILERAGYPTEKEGMHTLRRSAAYAMYHELLRKAQLGLLGPGYVPIRMVMTYLGHTNEKQTYQYIGVTHEQSLLNEMLTSPEPFYSTRGPSLSVVRNIG